MSGLWGALLFRAVYALAPESFRELSGRERDKGGVAVRGAA